MRAPLSLVLLVAFFAARPLDQQAAFDRHFVGIPGGSPGEVGADIGGESGGPMLGHGLQGLHGQRIGCRGPRSGPDPGRLARRYERFRAAG
ncbi:MAG: hypothetical protein OXG13_18190 [Gemmatimonadaceae bacterium]|nr:hypothetical protein [Gemmatimonadaceae bacterium]